jgi:single-stranded DNA-binding protein
MNNANANYISGIVKILETPKEKKLKNNILVTKFRAQFPQRRKPRIVTVAFWGKLARDVATYYKKNDYLLIEGYISVRNRKTLTSDSSKTLTSDSLKTLTSDSLKSKKSNFSKFKKIEITVLKLYPFKRFSLSSDDSLKKT